ncbi:O-antigen ligase family protein [Flavobacterium phragmitis]|uniref:O-antigen ligase-related domain-containing protein n=1 Tax=Flavobacterium phragmitis TaxID=739143 RepID=A0A1I1US64_9FLAO|nr:O-antigen ligase family protein [Flavobacterium phragmitis]SFD73616.1 hypothetical protein SAMN05216297_111157 [Flavobacterium phragmitis]
MNLRELSIGKDKLKTLLGYFILIDLLLLPYFQLVIMPISLPIVFFLFISNDIKIKNDLDFKLIIAFSFGVLISVIFSLLARDYQAFFKDNLKYAIQLISSFLFLFYFKSLNDLESKKVIWILHVFFVIMLGFVVLFMSDPFGTIEFIKNFYGKTTVAEEDFMYDFRFAYLFSDPNSAAYFVLMIYGYLLHNFYSSKKMLLISIITLVITLLTQSNGALGAFLFMSIIFGLKKFKENLNFKYVIIASIFILFLIISIAYLIDNRQDYILVESVYNRTFNATERVDGGGGRFHHWQNLFVMYPLPFGRGHTLFVDGSLKPPHSDFFGLLYRYGFVSLTFYLIFFLKHFRANLFIYIPAITCFAINELLADQKLFSIFLILIVLNEKFKIKYNAQVITN